MLESIRRIAAILITVTLLASFWLMTRGSALQDGDDQHELVITFLQTENDADCVVLSRGKSAVIIDTGEAADGPRIIEYLLDIGIENIPYLILTHPDKDHIGSTVDILDTFTIGRVFAPVYLKENDLFDEVYAKMLENNINLTYLLITKHYSFGDVTLTLYPPLKKYYKYDNNYSLGVLMKHGDVKAFFAGDAMETRINELLMMNLSKVDIYKVPHHGRASVNSNELMKTLEPKWAIVTAGSADSEIVETAGDLGTQLLYTLQGDVVFQSDGKSINLKK